MKPRATDSVIGRRAVVVDLAALKPCWVSEKGKDDWRKGRTRRSSTFTVGERREMGL